MSETLHAIYEGRRVGRLDYQDDRITFTYDEEWRHDPDAFPLSLSMPLQTTIHPDSIVRSFVSGLLPDDGEVLRRWGQKFQVSARNPFRLLENVGEECAGAVQFIAPERVDAWLSGKPPKGIDWLNEEQLAERIRELIKDRSRARQASDEGHFSLAGAQPKTGLYRDDATGRWGVPRGITPTTHILKPSLGEFAGYEENEHFCLLLAGKLGLAAAKSWTEKLGGVATIIVERFDRVRHHGNVIRVHQEDMCQALAQMPDRKYQNEGGPSAHAIIELIRDRSSQPQADVLRFVDAMIFNYLIAGTDAHAKNFGFLLGRAGQVRLARLYDLSSSLPYPTDIDPRRAKLAMKIGGEYLLSKMGSHQWEKAAKEWKVDRDDVFERLVAMAKNLPEVAIAVRKGIETDSGEVGTMLDTLVEGIAQRSEATTKLFS